MSKIPTVNIDDADAPNQMANLIRMAAVNALMDGDIDESDLDEFDADELAQNLVQEIRNQQ